MTWPCLGKEGSLESMCWGRVKCGKSLKMSGGSPQTGKEGVGGRVNMSTFNGVGKWGGMW